MVATTTILGDVVANVVGGNADIEVLLPPGADPHDYQISSSQAALLYTADLVITNGLGLEEGLIDVIEAAEEDGVNVLEVGDLLDPIPFSGGGDAHEEDDDHAHEEDDDHAHEEDDDHAHEEDDDHAHEEDDDHAHEEEDDDHAHEEDDDHAHEEDDDHAHEEEDDDHAHEEDDDHAHEEEDDDHADDMDGGHAHAHTGNDPHFWLDPLRVARAAQLIAEALTEIDPSGDWMARAEAYAATLTELDAEIQDILAPIPHENRVLITNHDSLGYFADRYDFEVIGVVIPGGSTLADPSSAELAALVEEIVEEGVKVIFAETIDSTALAEAVAAEAGTDVAVVTLHTGSLGEPGTETDNIVGMLRSNATRIADALS
ncbi:metal ABC transporter solute-binding protein, Zn/Mn family [Candidatus Spongiisocius sp.]|uniref:metal ABC transporter solute-binding protein, Zn/Mn family n=1 Tax=Candidatus Spongiisocius sp. TaxID=3101273 RepID=UPI003B5C485C